MRGTQSINKLFPSSVQTDPDNKVRRNIYNNERNVCMCYRFYYYYHIKRLRFDDCYTELAKDFFIAASTINKIISDNNDVLRLIITEDPNVTDLKKKVSAI